ncbi:MAG TPA: ABC transporter permease [Pseudonocardiaceae bacterium]|nr:ABC transporter permease [Pseudonocardiaceae bacterium]
MSLTQQSVSEQAAVPRTVDTGARWTRRLAETPEIGVVAACVLVFAGVFLARNSFATLANLQEMGRNLSEFGLLAVGESLVILTGGIDLSVGALAALAGVFGSWLFVSVGLPLGPCIVLTLLLCAAVGTAHGLFVTRLSVPPFVITLVTYTAARGAAQAITKSVPITISGQNFIDLNRTNVIGVPLPLIVFVVAAIGLWFFLERTYWGRQTYAVGGNAEAARLAGIPVRRRTLITYIVSGTLAGVVGLLISARLGLGDPSVATGYELDAIAAAVIGGVSLFGGRGKVLWTVYGALFLTVVDKGLQLMGLSLASVFAVKGGVILAAAIIDAQRQRLVARA